MMLHFHSGSHDIATPPTGMLPGIMIAWRHTYPRQPPLKQQWWSVAPRLQIGARFLNSTMERENTGGTRLVK